MLKCFNNTGWLAIVILLFSSVSFASNKIDIDLIDAPAMPMIKSLARLMKKNIIFDGAQLGRISLHLHQVKPKQAFYAVLSSQGLAKLNFNGVWYIASQKSIIKLKQNIQAMRKLEFAMSPSKIKIWQIRYAKAKEVAKLIKDDRVSILSKKGKVKYDGRSNTLFIQDVPKNLNKVAEIIQKVDVPIKQIRIEVKLASVDSDYKRVLGVNLARNAHSDQGGFLIARLMKKSYLDVALAALEKDGHAELISSPSLFASNQQVASIETGEELPYQEVSQGGATAVTFKKAVLSLHVLPKILPNKKILLKIQLSQDRPSERMILGVPSIRTRKMTTSVEVSDGETAVLGGIYETSYEQGKKSLPVISRIPLLGKLLSQTSVSNSKRELLIFVKPRVC